MTSEHPRSRYIGTEQLRHRVYRLEGHFPAFEALIGDPDTAADDYSRQR